MFPWKKPDSELKTPRKADFGLESVGVCRMKRREKRKDKIYDVLKFFKDF
jgi:hypothetical protein